jgi:hypothetical protein
MQGEFVIIVLAYPDTLFSLTQNAKGVIIIFEQLSTLLILHHCIWYMS